MNSRNWSFIPVKLSVPGPWKQGVNITKDLTEVDMDLANFFRGCLGRDKNIIFWKEVWLGDEPLCSRFPNLFYWIWLTWPGWAVAPLEKKN
ncbi:hypothetical protein HanIR_Chr10g0453181 [Helianthus annuus]|nr:hypothetical protein HanIR_Chr10g0453181 [Helianthus annuus]